MRLELEALFWSMALLAELLVQWSWWWQFITITTAQRKRAPLFIAIIIIFIFIFDHVQSGYTFKKLLPPCQHSRFAVVVECCLTLCVLLISLLRDLLESDLAKKEIQNVNEVPSCC